MSLNKIFFPFNSDSVRILWEFFFFLASDINQMKMELKKKFSPIPNLFGIAVYARKKIEWKNEWKSTIQKKTLVHPKRKKLFQKSFSDQIPNRDPIESIVHCWTFDSAKMMEILKAKQRKGKKFCSFAKKKKSVFGIFNRA